MDGHPLPQNPFQRRIGLKPQSVLGPAVRLAGRLLVLGSLVLTAVGCAPRLIPPEIEREIDPGLSLQEVRKDIEAQQGKRLLLGGEIIEVRPQKEKTELEILEKPLNQNHYPVLVDASQGRFILIAPGLLDPAIYQSGRRVTVVGKVSGFRTSAEGTRLPVLEERFLHLWPPGGQDSSEPSFSIGIGLGAMFGR